MSKSKIEKPDSLFIFLGLEDNAERYNSLKNLLPFLRENNFNLVLTDIPISSTDFHQIKNTLLPEILQLFPKGIIPENKFSQEQRNYLKRIKTSEETDSQVFIRLQKEYTNVTQLPFASSCANFLEEANKAKIPMEAVGGQSTNREDFDNKNYLILISNERLPYLVKQYGDKNNYFFSLASPSPRKKQYMDLAVQQTSIQEIKKIFPLIMLHDADPLSLKNKGNNAFQKKNFELALFYYNEAIRFESGAKPDLVATIWSNKGICHQELKDNLHALNSFTQTIIIDPKHVKAILNKAHLLKQNGEPVMALKTLIDYLIVPGNNNDTIQTTYKVHLEAFLEENKLLYSGDYLESLFNSLFKGISAFDIGVQICEFNRQRFCEKMEKGDILFLKKQKEAKLDNQFFKIAAIEQDVRAIYKLGIYYKNLIESLSANKSIDIPNHNLFKLAYYYLHIASEEGFIPAQGQFGLLLSHTILFNSTSLPNDINQDSLDYYIALSSQQGYIPTQCYEAVNQLEGDQAENALKILIDIHQRGFALASNILGHHYWDTNQNEKLGLEYMIHAANRGHSDSCKSLAQYYSEKGDDKTAKFYIEKNRKIYADPDDYSAHFFNKPCKGNLSIIPFDNYIINASLAKIEISQPHAIASKPVKKRSYSESESSHVQRALIPKETIMISGKTRNKRCNSESESYHVQKTLIPDIKTLIHDKYQTNATFFAPGIKFKKILERACQGNAFAQYHIGHYYYFNLYGISENKTLAAEYYKKSADQGHAAGQYCVAMCYRNGTNKDEEKAFQYFLLSAEQNYSPAQAEVGYCYLMGLGIEKDDIKAMEWLEKAAQQKDSNALQYLTEYQENLNLVCR